MDPRFRFDDNTEVLEALSDDILARVRVALPVKIAKDSDGHTVSVQPLIKAVVKSPDGELTLTSLPVLSDVPIQYGGGGGISVTHAHKDGDEGVYLFSHRSLDSWHQQGGEQPQIDARMLSHSDGFYLSNVRSDPRKIQGVSTSSTQTRTDDKKSLHDVSHTAITTIREFAVQQVNGAAIQSELKGSRQVIDATSILKVAKKILLNC